MKSLQLMQACCPCPTLITAHSVKLLFTLPLIRKLLKLTELNTSHKRVFAGLAQGD